MENNLKTVNCASAVDSLASLVNDTDELCAKARDLFCLSELLQEKVDAALFGGAQTSDRKDFYFVAETDHKIIGFLDSAVREGAEALDNMADALSGQLSATLAKMKRADEPRRVVSGHTNPVDDAIIHWRYAFQHWQEMIGDDGEKTDSPEAEAEEAALKALVSVPCKSLYDVQRKADLFMKHEYLSGHVAHHADDLLRSFSGNATS